ncbi:MAG TPA: hypothetical protein VNN15_06595, partial [Solirubrobacterales bacterium]|nr:hypothetical protein [Solirubrobacterales bacterium]
MIAVPSARAQASDKGPLSVLNVGPLTVSGEKGMDETKAKFTVLNSGSEPVRIGEVKFQASSSEAVKAGTFHPEDIPPEEAVRLVVTLSGVKGLNEEVTGQLVVKNEVEKTKQLPVAQALTVTPAAPDDPWPMVLIFGSFLLAAIVALGVRAMAGKGRLSEPVPDPKWSFSSWATTLTALGAAFGVVLGGVTYPPFPHHISKVELTNLNVLFGLLLLVGPFLFEASRRYVPVKKEGDKPQREGRKWMLLVASTFTLWAVVGQIGALGLLGSELVPPFWDVVCGFLAIVLAVLAARYF